MRVDGSSRGVGHDIESGSGMNAGEGQGRG